MQSPERKHGMLRRGRCFCSTCEVAGSVLQHLPGVAEEHFSLLRTDSATPIGVGLNKCLKNCLYILHEDDPVKRVDQVLQHCLVSLEVLQQTLVLLSHAFHILYLAIQNLILSSKVVIALRKERDLVGQTLVPM